MVHQAKLSPHIQESLNQVVQFQLDLLDYTLSHQTIEKTSLTAYLKKCAQYNGRESALASLVVGRGRKEGALKKTLEKIANGTDGIEYWGSASSTSAQSKLLQEKKRVVEMMRTDVMKLNRAKPSDTLPFYLVPDQYPKQMEAAQNYANSQPKSSQKIANWLKEMKQFLISFYDGLGSSNGLNSAIFSSQMPYHRQDYFRDFTAANPSQYVCVICDEASFRTIARGNYGGKHYHSDIEHYFPKSIYPHLSCHPYNLIPICKHCNSSLHGSKDPLAHRSGRRPLDEVFLPYKPDNSLSPKAVLTIVEPTSPKHVTNLDFYTAGHIQKLHQKLEVWSHIYDLPDRWSNKWAEIGDHLWRKIKMVFADSLAINGSTGTETAVTKKLELLLFYLEQDLGRDPLAYPCLWLLASALEQEIPNQGNPFLAEIQSWVGQHTSAEIESHINDLRERTRVAYNTARS